MPIARSQWSVLGRHGSGHDQRDLAEIVLGKVALVMVTVSVACRLSLLRTFVPHLLGTTSIWPTSWVTTSMERCDSPKYSIIVAL